MGKNVGLIKISGRVGNFIFRETEDGNVVQESCGPSAEKVKTHANFEQTRKNASEFAGAVRDAMLLRRAMGWLTGAVKHSRLNSHMNKLLHRVAMSDATSHYGYRCAHSGNIHLLKGFDLNHQLALRTALPMDIDCHLDAYSGCMQVGVPDKIVRRKKEFPAGATHFRIVSNAMVVDLEQSHYSHQIATSDLLPLNRKMPAFTLHTEVVADAGEVMMQLVGIVFFRIENGREELLRGGALQIVQVARKEVVKDKKISEEDVSLRDDDLNEEYGISMMDVVAEEELSIGVGGGVTAEDDFNIGRRDAVGHVLLDTEDYDLFRKKRLWKRWWTERRVHAKPSRVFKTGHVSMKFTGDQQE